VVPTTIPKNFDAQLVQEIYIFAGVVYLRAIPESNLRTFTKVTLNKTSVKTKHNQLTAVGHRES